MDIVKVAYESANGIFVQNRILNREYVVKPTSHAHCEMVYILRGKVGLTINNDYVECGEGEIIVLDAKVYHSQSMFEGVETELQVVEFNPALMPSFVRLDFTRAGSGTPFGGNRISAEVAKANNLSSYFKHIVTLAKRRNLLYKDSLILAEILRLITAINVHLDETIESRLLTEEDKRKRNLFEACVSYINKNVTQPIRLEDIAAAVHFSKSYLQHVFKQKMGMSISAYINAQKMSIARSMLASDESPLLVAQKLGYEYYTTFSVKFKQYYGVSPKDVRKVPFQVNLNFEKVDSTPKKPPQNEGK